MLQVAGALCKVASSLSMGDGSGGPSTPQHRMSAITMVTKDATLSPTTCIKAMHLFHCGVAAAEAHLAIEDEDMHAQFIIQEVEEI